MRRRRATLLVISASVALLSSVAAIGSAAAQEPPPSLRLLERTPWVADGDPFELTVSATGATTVEATIHAELVASGGRSRFRSQLAGGSVGDQLGSTRTLSPGAGDDWVLLLTVGTETATEETSGPAIDLPTDGVYPVEVRSFDADGKEIGRLLTHIVKSPRTETFPTLATVVVIDGIAPTATRPDGSVALDAEATAGIETVTAAVNEAMGVPFVYRVLPETIDALEPFDRSRLARSSAAVPDAPWAGLDEGAWLAESDLERSLAHQRRRGRTSIDDARLDRTLVSVLRQPPTAGRRARLIDIGAGVLLTSTDLAVDLESPAVGRLRPVRIAKSQLTGLIVDADLQGHLTTAAMDPVLAVHRVMADLAVLFYDRPRDERAAMLWIDSPAELGEHALAQLLSALDGAGGVATAVTPETALTEVGADTTVTLSRRPPPPLGDYASGLASAVASVRSWSTMLPPGDDRATELEASLDATAATDVIEQSAQWFARARAIVAAQMTGITVPQQQTVTLTERTADLPIRIDNALGYDAEVVLRLESTRLEFIGPDPLGVPVHLAPGANDIVLAVRARSTGSFPLDVQVLTPDGEHTLAEGRFSVRSTVLNGVGIALSVGSLLVLLVWWARHFRNGRRDRRLIEKTGDPSVRHEPVGADH